MAMLSHSGQARNPICASLCNFCCVEEGFVVLISGLHAVRQRDRELEKRWVPSSPIPSLSPVQNQAR